MTHAVIEGDVRIRDDKGTHGDAADDLTIGPLTHLEFDEADQEVRSTSHCRPARGRAGGRGRRAADRPAAEGRRLPPASPAGSPERRRSGCSRTIHIAVDDVGSTGIVPGGAPARPTLDPASLTCDGPARIDLPRPPPRTDPPDAVRAGHCPVLPQRRAPPGRRDEARRAPTRSGEPADRYANPDQINADNPPADAHVEATEGAKSGAGKPASELRRCPIDNRDGPDGRDRVGSPDQRLATVEGRWAGSRSRSPRRPGTPSGSSRPRRGSRRGATS